MAIFCGVCACRIFSAHENEGSFRVLGDFGGWDKDKNGHSRISDTCEDCAPVLREAVASAARKIAAKHEKAITSLAAELEGYRRRAEEKARDKEEFEREWQKRQRSKT